MKKINMKKVDMLLEESTILNFPFFFKLAFRYKKISFLIVFGLAILLLTVYGVQENVYWSHVRFQDMGNLNEPNKASLLALVGVQEKKTSEILNLRNSIVFTEKVAESLIAHKDFDRLRFDLNLMGDEGFTGRTLRNECNQSIECLKKELVEIIPKFYTITDSDRNRLNYALEVKSLDKFTVGVLVRVLAQTISDNRIDFRKQNLIDEENRISDLLIKAKFENVNADAMGKVQELNSLDEELKAIETRMEHLGKVLVVEQTSLSGLESRVVKTNKIINQDINMDNMSYVNKHKELRQRVEKLTSDIHALEIYAIQLNAQDKGVLDGLRQELIKSKKELSDLGGYRGFSNYENFLKDNETKVENTELEYNVLASQFKKNKESYDQLLIEKQKVLGRKLQLESEYNTAKPSMDFIKGLETHLGQLKLLKQTVVSDLRFDTFSTPVKTKKMRKIILIAYYLLGLFFLLFSFLSLAYLRDDRIYEKEDLNLLVKDVPVLDV